MVNIGCCIGYSHWMLKNGETKTAEYSSGIGICLPFMITSPNILQTQKNYAAKYPNRAGRNIAYRQHGLRSPRHENHGLSNLWLVNPLVKPDSQAIALAAGASDVIGNAQIVDTTWMKP